MNFQTVVNGAPVLKKRRLGLARPQLNRNSTWRCIWRVVLFSSVAFVEYRRIASMVAEISRPLSVLESHIFLARRYKSVSFKKHSLTIFCGYKVTTHKLSTSGKCFKFTSGHLEFPAYSQLCAVLMEHLMFYIKFSGKRHS